MFQNDERPWRAYEETVERMIATLGREAAARICRANLWEGLAQRIEAEGLSARALNA